MEPSNKSPLLGIFLEFLGPSIFVDRSGPNNHCRQQFKALPINGLPCTIG